MSNDLVPQPNGRGPGKRRGLTLKQTRFVEEYLVDGNAQRAVAAAWSACGSEVTPASAAAMGTRLLNDVKVQARIAEREAERVARLEVTQDQVVIELARIALSDPRKLFENGRLRPVEDWPDDVSAAVASIETETRPKRAALTKVRLWNKPAALDQLAKILKLYEPEVATTNNHLTVVFQKEY